jgi:D-alanyl-D-alanine carboxypeptidase
MVTDVRTCRPVVSRLTAVVVMLVVLGLTAGSCTSERSDRSATLEERVHTAVDHFLETRDIPGASVAVMSRGRLVTVVSGFADLEKREPIRTSDEFRLASITKNYLAALALDLDDEGVLRLDEPIGRWLPTMPNRLDFLRVVTMRQLLSHTSGLAQTFVDDRDRGQHLTVSDVIAGIPEPACAPGRCWSYADGNYVVAGVVLAAAAGRLPVTEIRARLLEPLGLERTHFLGESGVTPRPSYVLDVDPVTFEPVQPHRLHRQLRPIVTDSRAGEMMASAGDLARWADALFNGRAIGTAALVRMLDVAAMRDLPCPEGCPQQYGLGVFHYRFGGREFVGHDGSSGAIVASDIPGRLAVAILTNGGEHDTGRFLEAVVAAIDDH